MKLKFLRLLIQLALVISFFFPLMHQKDDEMTLFNGIEAILQGDYLILGNLVIGLIFIGVILHLVGLTFELIQKKPSERWVEMINIIVSLTAILSLLMVTFLGTFLIWLGYIYITLLILSTYLRYVDQKKNES